MLPVNSEKDAVHGSTQGRNTVQSRISPVNLGKGRGAQDIWTVQHGILENKREKKRPACSHLVHLSYNSV